jgi:hypothetical protein
LLDFAVGDPIQQLLGVLDRQKRIDEDGIAFAVNERDRIGNPSEIFLPGGRPWVELPRFLVKSFQFSLDIYFLLLDG